MTRTGGLLALTTGDVEGPLASRDLERWDLMCPPAHLLFFAPRTIERLLNDAGFEIVRILADGRVSTRRRLARPHVQQVLGTLGVGNVMTVASPSAATSRAAGRWRPASRGFSARGSRRARRAGPSPAARRDGVDQRARVGPEARGEAGLGRAAAAAPPRRPRVRRHEQRVLLLRSARAPTADRRSRTRSRTPSPPRPTAASCRCPGSRCRSSAAR